MTGTRTKFALLGICAVVLGLTSISATEAKATADAKWLILNSIGELKDASALPAVVQLEKDSSVLVLHAEILKIKVLFLCTQVQLVNAQLLAEGNIGEKPGSVKNSKALFSGCTVDLNGVAAPECTPTDPEDGKGFIVTKLLHATMLKTELGGDLLKVLPDTGETYVTWVLPAACPIGTSVPVIGKLIIKDCENLALTHLVKHLIETSAETELFIVSKTTEHRATLLGSAWAKLGGAHAGLQWSGDQGKEEDKDPKRTWLILNKVGELKEGAVLHASVGLEKDSSTLVLHTEILKNKVLFLCTVIKLIEAKLLEDGSVGSEVGVAKGSRILFSGCTTDLNGATAPECTPEDPIDGAGFILTKPFHALLVLGSLGEDLLQVLPDEGENFATVVLSATCPIGTSVPVIGKLFFKDCENLALTHQVKHLVESGPGTELWTISKSAEHVATLLGSAWASLTGEHAGLSWSGDPV